MKNVLITGGTGLVGARLIPLLSAAGYAVRVLTRQPDRKAGSVRYFQWNVPKRELPEEALRGIDGIIHLAGDTIGKRWTGGRKEAIRNSRIHSTHLLIDKLREYRVQPMVLVSASAVGYYGTITSDHVFSEDDRYGDDFLAQVCKEWEEAVTHIASMPVRTVILRTGVVLSGEGGMLQKILPLARRGLNGVVGSGKQYVPWIHIEDICRLYLFAVMNPAMQGVCNAVASEHVTQAVFAQTLADVTGRRIPAPPAPSGLLRLVFGEMAVLLLEGSRISNERLKETGFRFRFDALQPALYDLVRKRPDQTK